MPLNSSEIIPEIPLGKRVAVLGVHPDGIVALYKPCRILSHPNVDMDRKRSLLDASWSSDRERFMWKVGDRSYRFYLLHRLDSATSGVILGGVNPNLARELKGQFSKRKVAKTYHAIVSGLAKVTDSSWRDILRKKRTGSGLRVQANSRRGRPAETHVSIVETNRNHPKLSLLKLNPRTGRTHQLRVQCAKRQLPIVGDSTYGNFRLNKEVQKSTGFQRLFLHASSIKIKWKWKGRDHYFSAESKVPEDFELLMQLKF